MQLVTLDQLKQLAPAHKPLKELELLGAFKKLFGLKEDMIAENVSFKSIEDSWKSFFKKNNEDVEATYADLKSKVLSKYAPPIKFVGKGSSRAAFACIGGRCLKVATNDAGIAQNIQEWRNTKRRWLQKPWPCFVQAYEISDKKSLIVVECCAEADSLKQIATSLGIYDEYSFVFFLKAAASAKQPSLRSFSDVLDSLPTYFNKQDIYKQHAYEYATSIFSNGSKTIGQKIILSLISFWKKNGVESLAPADLASYKNWGFAIRDGEVAPVILDAGFSEDVADKYYS